MTESSISLRRFAQLIGDEIARSSWHVRLSTFSVVVIMVAASVEVGWLCRRSSERSAVLRQTAVAATMAFGALLVGVAYTHPLRVVWRATSSASPEVLREFWVAHPTIGFCVGFVLWDAIGWAYHWFGHHHPIGWATHRPHHTGTTYDLTVGLRQSWTPFHSLALHPLAALAGFSLPTVVACSALSNIWQFLVHTSFAVPVPRWLSAVVITPAVHRRHHVLDFGSRGRAANLGAVFTVWDRLAGTWLGPVAADNTLVYGVGLNERQNPFRLELAGWIDLFRSRRSLPDV
jgi:sterol desaturase/sphingolipid hydroxylase (fatty acid hydroxylase superfamily)